MIELALVFSLLGVPLLLGTVELGFVAYYSIEVSDAANAGALYGMQNLTNAADATEITTVAQADAPVFGANLIVTSNPYYACASAVGGTKYTTQSAATTACTGTGNEALEFIQVSTSVTVKAPITLPGLPKTYTLHGNSDLEVEK